jgi:ribosome maturation factor RimP
MNILKQKVLMLAKHVADEHGVEIFDIELLGRGTVVLRAVIDKEGGVTLDDCERFSRSLGALLDVEDPLPRSYTLEVSSPGLDRPLRDMQDFQKNSGKLARVITVEKIENQNFFIGRIKEVAHNLITLSVSNREIAIPFEKISKAKLEVELTCPKNSATS